MIYTGCKVIAILNMVRTAPVWKFY